MPQVSRKQDVIVEENRFVVPGDKATSYDKAPATDQEKKDEMEVKASLVQENAIKTVGSDEEYEKLRQLRMKVQRLFDQAKEARRKHDWEWMVRELYVQGYHFARYNRGTNTVTFTNRTGVRIPINLTWALMRAVRNQVTSFRPKWEVLPNVTTESAIENARYSVKVLDYLYEKLDVKRKIKEAINSCLVTSIGIWKFGVRKNGDITVTSVDPFDLYVDSTCRSANLSDPEYGAEYVIMTGYYALDGLKKNPNYKFTEGLEADSKLVSADYKSFLLQVTNWQSFPDNNEVPGKLLYECWMREWQDDGTFKLRVVTIVDGQDIPIRNELTDKTDYPFEVLQGSVSPLQLYGSAWVKHLIPINRVIDSLEAQIYEYNHFYAKGRFVIDKNSGVRIIVNQHGQIIEKNRGSQVTSLPINPLPSAPQMQIQNFRNYMEDLSGAHDVSLGRIPAGIRSGTGIAELRQADATNQDDIVDNLNDFLQRAGRRILRFVAENWNTTHLITATGLGGKADYFMVVGEGNKRLAKEKQFTFGEMKLPLIRIGKENDVRVQIGSWLAYTKEARKDELKELYRIGAIDQKALLEHLEFGDVDGILDRTHTEKLLDMRANRPSASIARIAGREMSDEELATAENELMLEGKDQPVEPDDDHEVHIAIHRQVADSSKYGDIVMAHINEHINLLRWISNTGIKPPATALPPAEGGVPGGAPPMGAEQPPAQVPNVIPTPDQTGATLGGGAMLPIPGGF